ncbi:MAG TPA: hypothetical protein O0X51_06500 [Methanocorpusculum sp.]|nr:hypothetical protein [Methanocorpusculum sp.]HJK45403.1 hypothetical protein [Methanocorpusculum sp.]HJK56645.1 hypothetical protein [Methanocorpusculum sp.]HJK63473.1 hypothetical protein [Methanocorpusculum sp.]HJK67882.1 hypothetical protein [Methanocorpusculum sp.]
MSNATQATDGTKGHRIGLRVGMELQNVIEEICKYENKSQAQVAYDAVALYADLWPVLHLMKSLKLNPSFKADYDEVRQKILEAIEKNIES